MINNLYEILRYKRKHESVTELLFIEDYLLPRLNTWASSVVHDRAGNIWATVFSEAITEPKTLFVAHLDTCHNNEGVQRLHLEVTESGSQHVSLPDSEKYNKETKTGSTCLGADDGVGIYILLELMKNGTPGTYLFTRGEERGLIGASWIRDSASHLLLGFDRSVEVDRHYFDEIITEQASGKCASHTFAKRVAAELGMGHSPSDKGVYTDNSAFNEYIPENINISAGYWSQHTVNETVDLSYVEDLRVAMLKVDWDSLGVYRDVEDLGPSYFDYSFGGYNTLDVTMSTVNTKQALDHDSSFDEYLEYVRANSSIVAWYLYLNGVDEYEIMHTWNDNFDGDEY